MQNMKTKIDLPTHQHFKRSLTAGQTKHRVPVLYIICHLDTLSIMRQNLNVCWEKKLVFIFHLQQT